MFFAWAFCSILSSCLFKSEFWLEKNLIFHFEIKFPTLHYSTELRSEQVQIAPALSSGILRISLAKRRCLTSLRPMKIRAANEFSDLAYHGFGPRNGAFYRGQLVFWPRVLTIILAIVLSVLFVSITFRVDTNDEWRMTILRRNWRYGNKEENYSTALGNCSRILIRVQFKLI